MIVHKNSRLSTDRTVAGTHQKGDIQMAEVTIEGQSVENDVAGADGAPAGANAAMPAARLGAKMNSLSPFL